MVAGFAPAAVGLKTTAIVHELPAANDAVVGHVVPVMLYCVGLAPLIAKAPKRKAPVPEFRIVTICCVLVKFNPTEPNASVAGVTAKAGVCGAIAVPFSAIVTGERKPL